MNKQRARSGKHIRTSIKGESSPLLVTDESMNRLCLDFAVHYFKKAEQLFLKINHVKGALITTERLL